MRSLTVHALERMAEQLVRHAFERAGVAIDGDRPWDVRVHDRSFYLRLIRNPAFQLGETYLDGAWDCHAIDELMERLLRFGIAGANDRGPWFWLRTARARVRNLQSRARADEVATAHYDLEPALYEAMLDDTMTYTCAHWRDPAESLAEAQRNKLRLICDKLELRPGETLLDIGCGFGGLAAFAATHYGARVFGITNSVQHHQLATTRYAGALPVEFARMDYRDLPALGRRFDKIASVEMISSTTSRTRQSPTTTSAATTCPSPSSESTRVRAATSATCSASTRTATSRVRSGSIGHRWRSPEGWRTPRQPTRSSSATSRTAMTRSGT